MTMRRMTKAEQTKEKNPKANVGMRGSIVGDVRFRKRRYLVDLEGFLTVLVCMESVVCLRSVGE